MSGQLDQNNEFNERYGKWIHVSYGLANIKVFATINAQEIGRLDCICIAEDKRICSSIGHDDELSRNLTRDNDHFLFSKLWVLAAYELTRVIRIRCKKKPRIINKGLCSKIELLESKFLRIRIPLAKLEPQKNHITTDFGIAHPTITPKIGCGWQISEDLNITRRELSDDLLLILEEIRKTTEQKYEG